MMHAAGGIPLEEGGDRRAVAERPSNSILVLGSSMNTDGHAMLGLIGLRRDTSAPSVSR